MMKFWRPFLVIVVFLLAPAPTLASDVRLSAAASLTDVIKEIIEDFCQTHPSAKLLPNFASSGALAKQIVLGAPTDIYISANPKWMDFLQQQGMIPVGSAQTLISNSLVFIGYPNPAIQSLKDLPTLSKIGIPSPQSSPAGKYAEQALTVVGLYQPLVAEKKLIFAKDVRQSLLYAERGEVDGAFVYRTDALLVQRAKILFAVPQDLYPQVVYPIALTESGVKNATAQEFFVYLLGDEARKVFAKYGFVSP